MSEESQKRMTANDQALIRTWLYSLLITAITLILARRFPSVQDMILHNNRGTIYGTLAAVFSSILGFMITATSIIIGYSQDERSLLLRRSEHYEPMFSNFIESIRVLAVAALAAFIALLLDRDSAPNFVFMGICVYFTFLSVFRVGNGIRLFSEVVQFMARETRLFS